MGPSGLGQREMWFVPAQKEQEGTLETYNGCFEQKVLLILMLLLSSKRYCNIISKDTYFIPFEATIVKIFHYEVGWFIVEICKDDFLLILCMQHISI